MCDARQELLEKGRDQTDTREQILERSVLYLVARGCLKGPHLLSGPISPPVPCSAAQPDDTTS